MAPSGSERSISPSRSSAAEMGPAGTMPTAGVGSALSATPLLPERRPTALSRALTLMLILPMLEERLVVLEAAEAVSAEGSAGTNRGHD